MSSERNRICCGGVVYVLYVRLVSVCLVVVVGFVWLSYGKCSRNLFLCYRAVCCCVDIRNFLLLSDVSSIFRGQPRTYRICRKNIICTQLWQCRCCRRRYDCCKWIYGDVSDEASVFGLGKQFLFQKIVHRKSIFFRLNKLLKTEKKNYFQKEIYVRKTLCLENKIIRSKKRIKFLILLF